MSPPPIDGRRRFALEAFGRTWREALVYALTTCGGPCLMETTGRDFAVGWRSSGPSRWASYYEQVDLALRVPIPRQLPLLKIRFADHRPLPDSFRQCILGIDIRLPLVPSPAVLSRLAPNPVAVASELAPALRDVCGEWRRCAPTLTIGAGLERFRSAARRRGYGERTYTPGIDLKAFADRWWSQVDQTA